MGFTENARRLSGLVPRVLGWPPDLFWNATPAELAAIFDWPEGHADAPLSRAELTRLMERERDG
jgi:uncharacterized phage protein (TIGR02216 family)